MKTESFARSLWGIQIPGWFLLLWLVYTQGISAFDYELGVSMGSQESAESITEVGAAFWYGFALGDFLIYIPLLGIGLVGHMFRKAWANILLAAALGITVYWPVVCLAALVDARDAAGWNISSELAYWVVLPVVAVWGLWGIGTLLRGSGK